LAAVLARRAWARRGRLRAKRRAGAKRALPIAQAKASTLEKWNACLRRRRFGLPAAQASAHNLLGQQGLKISIPKIDRLNRAVQSNKVYLPQEAIDDLRKLGPAADKR
jgi:hypothetical protein